MSMCCWVISPYIYIAQSHYLFLSVGTPQILYVSLQIGSLLNVLLNLVEFCSVMSFYRAWPWSNREHLRRVGKNDGAILRRLLTKVDEILGDCREAPVVSSTLPNSQFLWQIVNMIYFLTIWQSLAEFHFLTSVCEAWQSSRMQNLRRVGKNSGLI